ncbi:MAG: phosphatidylserine decarboxylase, partial [Burkholderiales bacterium]|nr:phosphatidylserine decarboxylase [Anaerolineae bacterium]
MFNSTLILLIGGGLLRRLSDSRWWQNMVLAASLAIYGVVLAFFRVPSRKPLPHPDFITAPAHGKVVAIERVHEPHFLRCDCVRVSIYLSLFDMHMSTAPVTGRVIRSRYEPGQYLLAFHPKASELNERHSFHIETPEGAHVLVRLIAGTIARRIYTDLMEGQYIAQGDEIGFIKFGSRVDVFL